MEKIFFNFQLSNNYFFKELLIYDKYSYLYDASLGAHMLNAYISDKGVMQLDIDANTKAIIMPRIL